MGPTTRRRMLALAGLTTATGLAGCLGGGVRGGRGIKFDGETVRLVGLPDAQIPSYRFWLPHGTGPRSYYRAELDALTSILRPGEEDPNRTRCVEETVAAVETIVDSLGPDPETTIDEVREKIRPTRRPRRAGRGGWVAGSGRGRASGRTPRPRGPAPRAGRGACG